MAFCFLLGAPFHFKKLFFLQHVALNTHTEKQKEKERERERQGDRDTERAIQTDRQRA